MVELFFSSILLVFTLLSFQNVYCSNGVYRCYLGLYKGVVERSVTVVDSKGAYGVRPFFYLPALKRDVNSYFKENLARYCLSYTHTVEEYPEPFLVFGVEGDETLSSWQFVAEVRITFSAKISDFKTIKKSAYFAVERTDNEPK